MKFISNPVDTAYDVIDSCVVLDMARKIDDMTSDSWTTASDQSDQKELDQWLNAMPIHPADALWLADVAAEMVERGQYDAAVALMDDDIREAIHADGVDSDHDFLAEYMIRHAVRYDGAIFEI